MAKQGYVGVTYQMVEHKGETLIFGWGREIFLYGPSLYDDFLDEFLDAFVEHPYYFYNKWDILENGYEN